MIAFSSQGTAKADSNREFFYGHSLLRWLNDGLDVGPGLVEKWSSNADTSEWTLHFRKGLKWSDGTPFSTDDVLFWWEDIVLPGHYAQVAPGRVPVGQGHAGQDDGGRRPDPEDDLRRTGSRSPPTGSPTWANGAIGLNGPIWVLPKHYAKQFHPKYNKKRPEELGHRRWPVGAEDRLDAQPGLPDADRLPVQVVRQQQGRRPRTQPLLLGGHQGRRPAALHRRDRHQRRCRTRRSASCRCSRARSTSATGPFNQIDLSDVSALSQSKEKAGTEIVLWDSGSGTGSMFFLNYDYPGPEAAQAVPRAEVPAGDLATPSTGTAARKSLYFQTGELTTGTLSPKAIGVPAPTASKSMSKPWRDTYVKHDLSEGEVAARRTRPEGHRRRRIRRAARRHQADHPDRLLGRHRPDRGGKDDQLVQDARRSACRWYAQPGVAAVLRRPVGGRTADGPTPTGRSSDGAELSRLPAVAGAARERSRWAPLEGQFYARDAARRPSTPSRTSTRGSATRRGWSPKPAARSPRCGSSTTRASVEPDEHEAHPAGLGDDQDPHRPRPVLHGHASPTSRRSWSPRPTCATSPQGKPRSGRFRQPVEPPDARRSTTRRPSTGTTRPSTPPERAIHPEEARIRCPLSMTNPSGYCRSAPAAPEWRTCA